MTQAFVFSPLTMLSVFSLAIALSVAGLYSLTAAALPSKAPFFRRHAFVFAGALVGAFAGWTAPQSQSVSTLLLTALALGTLSWLLLSAALRLLPLLRKAPSLRLPVGTVAEL